jgi:hypothetical protein
LPLSFGFTVLPATAVIVFVMGATPAASGLRVMMYLTTDDVAAAGVTSATVTVVFEVATAADDATTAGGGVEMTTGVPDRAG